MHDRDQHPGRTATPGDPWGVVLASLGLEAAEPLGGSVHSPARRTYRAGDRCVKVRLLVPDRSPRRQDLRGEWEILHLAAGIPHVPGALDYARRDGFEALTVAAADGQPFGLRRQSWGEYALTVARLSWTLLRLAARGIAHGDVTPGNVLVDAAGVPALIDFDQAQVTSRLRALRQTLLGRRGESTGSLFALLNQDLRMRLSPRVKQWIRRLVPATRAPRAAVEPLPVLPPDADEATRRMLRAWQIARTSRASSPDAGLAYYRVTFGGVTFPGEREWTERWAMLREATETRGRRVLELGCNMGLLSTSLLRAGAAATLGVDHDPDIVEAAREVAAAHGVTPEFQTCDFDAPEAWEERLLAFRPDVVFCLNVTHWLRDPARMFAFLGRAPEVVFEGHDPYEIEVQRLRDAGFTDVRLLGVSERGRCVLHARRDGEQPPA